MNSILGQKPPRIIVKPDYTDEFTILGLMIIAILGFWIWVMYMIYRNTPTPKYFLKCDPGKCATNIYNGEKRCGTDDGVPVVYDPIYEVCNSRFTCESTLTPYAVQLDGSTNLSGICPDTTICRCVKTAQCSYDTTVAFTSTNGILGQVGTTDDGSRTILVQTSLSNQGDAGVPIDLTEPTAQYCLIRLKHFDRVVPRTPECNFAVADDPTLDEARACINSNPCTIGRLAFRPLIAADFTYTAETLADVPVGCVIDLKSIGPCVSPQVPVWDLTQAKVVCL